MALLSVSGRVTFAGCTLSSNVANVWGGAVFASSASELYVARTTFFNNTAQQVGAAFLTPRGMLSLGHCPLLAQFLCSPHTHRGAPQVQSTPSAPVPWTPVRSASSVRGPSHPASPPSPFACFPPHGPNSSPATYSPQGGAIDMELSGLLQVQSGCVFEANNATYGGALSVTRGAAVLLNGTVLKSNTAVSYAAGLECLDCPTLVVDRCGWALGCRHTGAACGWLLACLGAIYMCVSPC